MLARQDVEIRRPPHDFDELVDWFDRVSGNLVLLEEYAPGELRAAVEAMAHALDAHLAESGSRPRFGVVGTGETSRAAVLDADHERLRASAEQLRALLRVVERDDHGGNRQALGQYGRVLTEALRRHRRDERSTAGGRSTRSRARGCGRAGNAKEPPPARRAGGSVAVRTSEAVWVEKYRPTSLRQMVGQETIVPLLRSYAEKRSMPHLLFAGPPGTGKTTAAIALARDLYGEEWRQNFLELNSSDERGIDTVRTTIKGYARTAPIGDVGFKILLLDEADNLTSEAQASLRRLMERYSGSCRFILSCNYSSRIIEPIQSRCAVFRFRAYSTAAVREQLERIAKAEGKKVDVEAYDAILAAANGDLRRAINLLQLTATHTDHVTAKTVQENATIPLRREVEAMLSAALAGDFLGARERLYALFTDRGAAGEEILKAIHSYLPELPESVLPAREKIRLVEYLAEVDFRLAQGAGDRVQLESVLAHLAAGSPKAK